jgi:DNA gyrase subunit B
MSPEAFRHVLDQDSFTTITTDDVPRAKEMLEICFGKDTAARKELLLDEESMSNWDEVQAEILKTAKKNVTKKTTKKKVAKKTTKKKVAKKK